MEKCDSILICLYQWNMKKFSIQCGKNQNRWLRSIGYSRSSWNRNLYVDCCPSANMCLEVFAIVIQICELAKEFSELLELIDVDLVKYIRIKCMSYRLQWFQFHLSTKHKGNFNKQLNSISCKQFQWLSFCSIHYSP